jgi:hypothetical protein
MAGRDDIDDLIDQVSGVDEVGARAKRNKAIAMSSQAMEAARAKLLRTTGEVARRAPMGFGAISLATTVTTTYTQRPQRSYHPDVLLIVPSATGLLITSFKVGDEEQLMGSSVPVEMYGTAALSQTLPDDFSAVASGMDLALTMNNPTAGTITGSAGVKGQILR